MIYKLEVIAFDIESCLIIEQSGCHRIELCANPMEGGTTPSYGMIKAARKKVGIGLFPIIRPRGGDFLYSNEEFAIMADDVAFCKDIGCDGVVTGMLQQDGSIDVGRTAKLVSLAYPMEVTFHRAFDHCNAPFEALKQLAEIGCQRILTSGQQPVATAGAHLIASLVEAAGSSIIVMPGSGVRENNIKELAGITGAAEFHASMRWNAKSRMDFIHPAFAGHSDYTHATADASAIKSLLHTMEHLV